MAQEGDGEQSSMTDSEATEAAWRRAAAAEKSAYNRFCEKLRHPSAKPVVHRMHQFVTEFAAGRPILEAADEVHRFQDRAAAWMLSKAVVFAADADEEGTREAEEGLEKFLLCRLYPKLFAADPADREADAFLSKHLSGLSWIELQHLGIPPVELTLFPTAIQELRSIDEYRAPKDKLLCILNACNVINDILKATHEGLGDGKVRALSADDFLPLLIFLVIRANPAHLHSNAEFVASLRHPARMNGEDAYFATAFCSAKEFLANSGPSAFEVTLEEYTMRYAHGVASAEASAERFWRGAATSAEASSEGAAVIAPSAGGSSAAAPPTPGDTAATDSPRAAVSEEGSGDDSDEERERLLFSVREAQVYRIPPASSAAGHKADHWQRAICRGPLRVVGRGARLCVRLFDGSTGNLFAQSEMPADDHDRFVEPVVDSSRYFVLKVMNGERHAFVGIGFGDRNDSFDFKCALADFTGREAAAARRPAEKPASDLSLKEGDKITIKLRGVASQRAPEKRALAAAEGASTIPALPPPAAETRGRGGAAEAGPPRVPAPPTGEAQPPAAGLSGAGDLMDLEPADLMELGAESGGSGERPGDPDPFGDFVLAAAPEGQQPAEQSRAASSASSPSDFTPGGGAWDDFGSFKAWAEPARPPQPQAQQALGQPHSRPAKLEAAEQHHVAAVLLGEEAPLSQMPAPFDGGPGEPVVEVDPFAQLSGIGQDPFGNEALPCR